MKQQRWQKVPSGRIATTSSLQWCRWLEFIVAEPKQPLSEHTWQRNQLKTLDDKQKQDIIDICKNRDENEDSQINEKLATFGNEEDLKAQSIRNHCKLKDFQRLNILNLHLWKI